MEKEAAFLYAKSCATDEWENEEHTSYDVDTLHREYRERLFSDKAVALMAAQEKLDNR